jgi:hypothetical protein
MPRKNRDTERFGSPGSSRQHRRHPTTPTSEARSCTTRSPGPMIKSVFACAALQLRRTRFALTC